MAKLVDAQDLKFCGCTVSVRVRLLAPTFIGEKNETRKKKRVQSEAIEHRSAPGDHGAHKYGRSKAKHTKANVDIKSIDKCA